MGAHTQSGLHVRWTRLTRLAFVLITLTLCLVSCGPSGDSNLVAAPPAPTTRVETQAVDNILDLYSQALRQEDMDRLQALLQLEPTATPETRQGAAPRQAENATSADLASFRQTLSNAFRSQAVTNHTILPDTIMLTPDATQVTFVEVESVSDPLLRFHHSHVYRTTFMLQRTATADTVRFRISGARRDGPIVTITTQGQVQTDVRSRVTLTASEARFALGRADVVDPATGEMRALRATATGFEGAFTASNRAAALPVQLHDNNGKLLEVAHPYRARGADDRVVESISGTGGTRLLAITHAPDGTIWTGGDRGASLYQVMPGAAQAQLIRPLISDPAGRIEDLVVDSLGRLHAVVFSPQRSGVIVRDQDTFCQTVNVLDATYPLQDATGQPSVSTRAVAAAGGAIWLLGSDAGVVQVSDGFRDGQCPASGVEVQYPSVLRREDGELPVNTVPALAVSHDGTLWIGSALGLGRLKDGQLTRVPFDPSLSFQGDAATLETFFQEVAQAIFEARPVDSVAVGDVSFVEAFGSALVKEDLIFSLVEDGQGRLWIGTLGGGIRRVDVRGATVEQTLHMTRQDGLASNIIFALSVAPDGAIWAATDDGVSRIEANGETVAITTYTALDGLELPARDIAVDDQGTAWVATDGGLFRIQAQRGQIAGQVHDASAQPVAEAEVIVHGTAVRTVTDAEGRFEASAIAPGNYLLEVDGRTSSSAQNGMAFREITVKAGEQLLSPVVLVPQKPRELIDVEQGGLVTFADVPGATLEVPPQSAQFPAGETLAIGLSLLPVGALPRPLPSGFDGVVAAQLVPPGLAFTTRARLSLPNPGQTEAGQLLVLQCLDDITGTYDPLGLGRVSADGAVIETLSGGLTTCSTVVFATTASDAIRVFLRPVSGNNQQAQPGEELPEPLVVRLEDQFGNPITGEPLAAVILQGQGELVQREVVTDVQGEARFRVQVGTSDDDLVVQVTTSDIPDIRPAQFFAIIGEFDTPGLADALAVANGVVYVSDRAAGGFTDRDPRGGLSVIDVRDPMQPELRNTIFLKKDQGINEGPSSLAIRGTRLYLGATITARLYIVDITAPLSPDFAVDRDGDGLADVILSILDFPGVVRGQLIKEVAVQGERVYAISNTLSTDPASLYVVDVQDSVLPRLLSTTTLPIANPTGVAVLGDVVYVTAEDVGLLVFDVRNSAEPTLVATLGDPEPDDGVEVLLSSGIVLADNFAYMVETHRNGFSDQPTDVLAVFDVRIPKTPQRRGSVPLTMRPRLPLLDNDLAVANSFAYVVRGNFGLEAIDISDPDAPRRVGIVDTPSEALQVATTDNLIYLSDSIFDLQVIQGPGTVQIDTDSDGIIDFFDAFPTDATEALDSDGDRQGDQADLDDDNDGFTDAEETAATPPISTTDPLAFPVQAPPSGATTILVDAATTLLARDRRGTQEAPYRSISEALQALRSRPTVSAPFDPGCIT